MRFSSSLFKSAVAFALAASVYAEDASDVLSLTASDFDTTVNPESLILVEFFAPWCGHCKALAPHYEEAATELKNKSIKLAKVDCVDQAEFCQQNGISGYPTLKVYRNGTPSDYTGPRKADGIISYMVKQSLPAVSDVTADSIAEFKTADKIVAVAYLSSKTDAPAPEFSAAAEKHRDDYLFGLSTDASVAAAEGITPPAIVVYRSFDAPKTEYPYPVKDAKVKDVSSWLEDLSIPVLGPVDASNYATYAGSPKPLAYIFLDPSAETKDTIIDSIKPVAEKYKSKVNFVWIDAIKFGDHGKALNIQSTNWPTFVLQDTKKQLKYPFAEGKEVTAANVEEWVSQYLDGSLKPELKSEPLPESQDESVFTLVGRNFEDVVFDDSKDVFAEFYAPWCGHCKRLKPTWDSLADNFADVKDRVIIAKMDATENDLPPSVPFQVSGFPTLKFKPAGTREWLDYSGDRSLESLIAFTKENAKNDLTPPEKPAAVPVTEEQVPLEAKKADETKEETHDEL